MRIGPLGSDLTPGRSLVRGRADTGTATRRSRSSSVSPARLPRASVRERPDVLCPQSLRGSAVTRGYVNASCQGLSWCQCHFLAACEFGCTARRVTPAWTGRCLRFPRCLIRLATLPRLRRCACRLRPCVPLPCSRLPSAPVPASTGVGSGGGSRGCAASPRPAGGPAPPACRSSRRCASSRAPRSMHRSGGARRSRTLSVLNRPRCAARRCAAHSAMPEPPL